MTSYLKTGRSLWRTTHCSKSPPCSASCDLVSSHDSHHRRRWVSSPIENPPRFYQFYAAAGRTVGPGTPAPEPGIWSPTGGRRADSVVLLFLLIKGVRRDKEISSVVVLVSLSLSAAAAQIALTWFMNLFQKPAVTVVCGLGTKCKLSAFNMRWAKEV